MKKNNKNIVVWGLVITMFLIMMQVSSNTIKSSSAPNEYTFSELESEVANSKIAEAEINEAEGLITGETADGKRFRANTSRIDDRAGELFDKYNVPYEYSKVKGTNTLAAMFINVLPLLLIIGVSMLIFRSMQGGGRGGAMSFGKSRAKMLTENTNRVTFEDVAGVESAKEDLKEVVEFLEDPSRFTRLGARIPTGALLVGPPGTGKTLLARAVAGEAGVPFFTISGSDFVEMFVGVGASRVRDMFADARKNAPCIIFIDEIDAVGRHRGVGTSGGHEEREQTLNQLLVEMDGFQGDEGVIIIAATNRPDVLDKALLRPGRFDRQIEVPYPDINGREKILEVHMKGKPIAADLDVKYIARGTPGFSGADLMNLVNEAALLSARRNKLKISMREFEDARDKVLMGAERRSLSMTDQERKNTAYHEAGHAIVGLNMKGSLPIHKATIIPRGRALGMVQYMPERDQISQSREEMIARMAMAMGGRAAEEIKFGYDKVTSGASSDIEQVTRIATAMVTEWGLSDAIGPIAFKDTDQQSFHPGIGRGSAISPETAKLIESEIRRFVTEAHETALKILKKKKKDWTTLAEALLEYETLSGDEITVLLSDGIKPKRTDGKFGTKPAVPAVPSTKKGSIGSPQPES
ncbi:ATP-dependent zinc metalloprotease FtsH [Hellea sp.]|nr:ATP-dependent zinc metalloprotease FtsH [Hellea sp.]MDB4844949.1 ATP-dependent zinc metalloprotease FtsH [Hellea sp.]MDC0422491.1 ATP-dependent zinc metalloprotease FtsH [Hellea sp.]MDC0651136.1 ATP-dependent zinc metalloprotease FtsH [Hellea sp.]MDC1062165.1 ATP-dependent zinc metalloprotease FtsH [Hellea sp.]